MGGIIYRAKITIRHKKIVVSNKFNIFANGSFVETSNSWDYLLTKYLYYG